MASYLNILNSKEIKKFDSPPIFTGEERKHFFYLTNWTEELIYSFRTPTNKVGFILQLGYFKAVGKFFNENKFNQKDIDFVSNTIGVSYFNLNYYKDRSFRRHQEIILEKLGYKKFNEKTKSVLIKEAQALCIKQIKPKLILMSLLDFLKDQKIEIPNYNTFQVLITESLRNFERVIINNIESCLSENDKDLLDKLLNYGEEYIDGEKQSLKIKRFKITLLKKSNQSTKPSKIKENVDDLQCLESLYKEIEPILNHLNLSPELIQYYAQIVMKVRGFQINQFESRKYLLLIAFVAYQYFKLSDILIEVLMQSVQTSLNSTEREHREQFYLNRKLRHNKFNFFSQKVSTHLSAIKQAHLLINDNSLSAEKKIITLQKVFSNSFNNDLENIECQLSELSSESSRIIRDEDYYDFLEKKSVKLQNRVSSIIKTLHFDPYTSNIQLIEAIENYCKKDGNLGNNSPLDFLEKEEHKFLYDSEGKIRKSLYKTLLFNKVASSVRSGAINLKYSYKYKTFENYLIPEDEWIQNKDTLLERSGLLEFKEFSVVEKKLKYHLKNQFSKTNENINSGLNKYIKFLSDGSLILKTPKLEENKDKDLELYPKNRYIPLYEVLSSVNQAVNFTNNFEHKIYKKKT